MATMHIVCPNCGAKGVEPGFLAFELPDPPGTPEAKRGEVLKSLVHFGCCACDTDFPLFTYTVGGPDTLKFNAVDDAGNPWVEPEPKPWWTSPAPACGEAVHA